MTLPIDYERAKEYFLIANDIAARDADELAEFFAAHRLAEWERIEKVIRAEAYRHTGDAKEFAASSWGTSAQDSRNMASAILTLLERLDLSRPEQAE